MKKKNSKLTNKKHWPSLLTNFTKCFVAVQIFWARPKIWLHLVLLQKLLCRHKNQFYWMQIFLSDTKCLRLPQYVNRCLVWHKKIWTAQNILGPVNSLAGIGSWSACKHYNKDLSKNRKASQPWLPSQESYAFIAPSVFSHISEFLPWIKMNSPDVSTVVFYALFFYGSKMISDCPNDFGQVPISAAASGWTGWA